MAFYLRTVVVASLIGGLTFSGVTTLLLGTLDLAESTLPTAALSGLALGTMVAVGLWMVLRLQSGQAASPSIGRDQKAILAGLVAAPVAAWLSIMVFTAWNENGPMMPELAESLVSLSIAGTVLYLLILSTVHVAIGNTG